MYTESLVRYFSVTKIYILKDGRQKFKGHEQDNLRRMLQTLRHFDEYLKRGGYVDQKREILDAIENCKLEAINKSHSIDPLHVEFREFELAFAEQNREKAANYRSP